MANNNFGASFGVDISALKAGLAQANKLIRETESEFRAAAAGMDDWTKSEEGLAARQQTLNKQIDLQRQKITSLTAEKDKLIEAMTAEGKTADEIASATDSLNKMITSEAKQLDKLKKEYDKTNSALNKFNRETDETLSAADQLRRTVADQEKTLGDLKEEYLNVVLTQGKFSREAQDLAKQIDNLSADIDDNKRSLGELGDAAENAGDGFTVAKGAIATFVGNGLSALASGVKDAIGSLFGLASETREYRDDMSRLQAGFQSAGYTAKEASDAYKGFYSILGESDRSVEAVNHLAQMGLSQQQLANWTDIAAGVMGTFGDSLPIEGLTEAANETAKTGEVTGALADALNWAGLSEEEFNKKLGALNTEQERAAYITDTLSGKYADAANKYKELNGSIIEANAAQARFDDATADLGQKVEPVTTAIRDGFARILEKAVELTDNVDFSQIATKVSDGFSYFIDDVLPAVVDGFQWVVDNKDLLIAGIGGIATAFAAFKAYTTITSIVGFFQTLFAAVSAGTPIMAAFNTVLLANPIGLVVAAIAGLVAAFVLLWNNCESFREFWINLWEIVSKAFTDAFDWMYKNLTTFATKTVPKFINTVVTWFSELPGKILTWLTNALVNIITWGINMRLNMINAAIEAVTTVVSWFINLATQVATWLGNIITNIINWGINMKNTMATKASEAINAVVSWFSQLPGKIATWLSNAVQKVVDWGVNLAKTAKNAAQDMVDTVVETIENLPSKMLDIGENLVESLWNGITNMGDWLSRKVNSFVDGIKEKFEDGFDIGSPSKWAKGIGGYVTEGLGLGLLGGLDKAVSRAAKVTNGIKGQLSRVNEVTAGSNSVINNNDNSRQVNVTQYITNTAPTSRLQLWKNKNETVAAVKLATT